MKLQMINNNITTDPNNLVICLFGSRVYGTNKENSDYDYIIIQDKLNKIQDTNIHCYTRESFIAAVKSGDIACLEVYFGSPAHFIKKDWEFPKIEIDKESFRRNISMITSNSWVKGKKKLIVIADYDYNIALKSVFHSLRILDFALQISKFGTIQDYTSSSYILADLYKMGENKPVLDLWNDITQKYRPVFNKLSTEFRILNPIEKQTEKSIQLKDILISYGVFSEELYMDLKGLI